MEMNSEIVESMKRAEKELGIPHENQHRPFDIVRDMPGADEFVRAAIRSYGRRYNKETGEFEDMPEKESQNKNEQ